MRQLVLYNLKGEKLSLGGTPCVDSCKLIKSQLSPLKTIKDLRQCHMGEMKVPRIMFLCKSVNPPQRFQVEQELENSSHTRTT